MVRVLSQKEKLSATAFLRMRRLAFVEFKGDCTKSGKIFLNVTRSLNNLSTNAGRMFSSCVGQLYDDPTSGTPSQIPYQSEKHYD